MPTVDRPRFTTLSEFNNVTQCFKETQAVSSVHSLDLLFYRQWDSPPSPNCVVRLDEKDTQLIPSFS